MLGLIIVVSSTIISLGYILYLWSFILYGPVGIALAVSIWSGVILWLKMMIIAGIILVTGFFFEKIKG